MDGAIDGVGVGRGLAGRIQVIVFLNPLHLPPGPSPAEKKKSRVMTDK